MPDISTRIVYGYTIGNEESGFCFEDPENLPEWTEQEWSGLGKDFIELASCRLLDIVTGFKTIPYHKPRIKNYYDLKHKAEEQLGIEFHSYGMLDWQEWTLGFEMFYSCDSVSELDHDLIAALLNPLNMADMDRRLREAIRILNLKPENQHAPRLLLLARCW